MSTSLMYVYIFIYTHTLPHDNKASCTCHESKPLHFRFLSTSEQEYFDPLCHDHVQTNKRCHAHYLSILGQGVKSQISVLLAWHEEVANTVLALWRKAESAATAEVPAIITRCHHPGCWSNKNALLKTTMTTS